MSARDRLLAVLVAVCWGLNFPATAIALHHFPPMLLVAVRFAIVAVPTLLFIPRPQVQWRWLIGTGLGIGLLQFAFLYAGMAAGMPSGLASLVLQASAPFTVVLAALFLRERLSGRQVLGIVIAVAGLAAIALHRGQSAALLPVILTLCGGLGWAVGNVCSRKAQAPKPLHLTLWMSIVPPIPMLAMSVVFEGPQRIGAAITGLASPAAIGPLLGLAYIVVVATGLGYGLWNTLLSRHPSSTVAPFSMLVPVVGVLSSWLIFGELLDPVELGAGALIVGGVLLGSLRRRAVRIALEQQDPRPSAIGTR